ARRLGPGSGPEQVAGVARAAAELVPDLAPGVRSARDGHRNREPEVARHTQPLASPRESSEHAARMTTEGEALARMREICLALPDTKETLTWGQPHFRVLDKIFAGCGSEGGTTGIGFKLTLPHQAQIVKRPGFSIAPYVGRHGWVSVDVAHIED